MKLVVKSKSQTAELWSESYLVKTYRVSTAAKGLGCEEGSHCTPSGALKVSEKIGWSAPRGTVFTSRIPSERIWEGASAKLEDHDLVLTRILWLEGGEPGNANTKERYIYLHGTNHEGKLGTPVSHGCIRFANDDICEIYEVLDIGAEVFVE